MAWFRRWVLVLSVRVMDGAGMVVVVVVGGRKAQDVSLFVSSLFLARAPFGLGLGLGLAWPGLDWTRLGEANLSVTVNLAWRLCDRRWTVGILWRSDGRGCGEGRGGAFALIGKGSKYHRSGH